MYLGGVGHVELNEGFFGLTLCSPIFLINEIDWINLVCMGNYLVFAGLSRVEGAWRSVASTHLLQHTSYCA